MCILPVSLDCKEKENKHTYFANQTYTYIGNETVSYKVMDWEIMFIVKTVHFSLCATLPTPLIFLPFTSNGSQVHRFTLTTVQ